MQSMGAADSYKPGTFARFFRPVEGRHVSRFGTARSDATGWLNAQVIGGRRPPMTDKEQLAAARRSTVGKVGARPCNPVELDLESVTAITQSEARKYGRIYDRQVREGSLIEAKEADYIDYLRKQDEAAKAAVRAAEEKKKAVAAAAEREARLAEELAASRENHEAGAATGPITPEEPAP